MIWVFINLNLKGIDIITDGEMRRENYIYGFLRSVNGIDFNKFTDKVLRNGAI